MLTFIVFVFSIMLVTVQLASAQLTPRIIASFFRSRILRISLTVFVFAFAYTLAALSRIEDSVPPGGRVDCLVQQRCVHRPLPLPDRLRGQVPATRQRSLPPCSLSTRFIGCYGPWPSGNWTRAGSMTKPDGCA